MTARCPCGMDASLESCCGRYHAGALAPDPVALMRSRYAAFALGLADYLVQTHHPRSRGADLESELQASLRPGTWKGLVVVGGGIESEHPESGWVEFSAFGDLSGPFQIHERSRFERVGERWYYLDGQILPPLRPGRNDTCPCRSGRKWKQCHGRTLDA